jgi:dolichol-phosphate mannosyltransferase
MRAAERDTEATFKVWTAKLFYRLISRLSDTKIPLDSGDFRLMDRRVVDALLSMPERDRFVRGMVSWLGFSQIGLPYHRAARTAGETKFTLFKMLRFAADAIFSFSVIPLRIATWTGFFASGLAIFGILYSLYERLFGSGLTKGWASTVLAVLFLGGVQLVALGIIGEYIGRIYGESKRRPSAVVEVRPLAMEAPGTVKRLPNASRFIDLIKAGVTIRLQCVGEVPQARLRIFALAIR